jgi:hypothetical protein
LQFGKCRTSLVPIKKQKDYMPITIRTTDQPQVSLDNFQNLQKVANRIQASPAIKGANNDEVMYNGHSVSMLCGQRRHWADIQNELEGHIPNLLSDMEVCSWKDEIYSKGRNVFQEGFIENLNFLLAWFTSIKQRKTRQHIDVHLTASQVRDIIEWIKLIMDKQRLQYSGSDFVCVETAINSL